MAFNNLIPILAFFWVLCAPIGYLFVRWSYRAMGIRWTHNNRITAVVSATLYGPLTPILAVLIVLSYKLDVSDWGNKEVRW